MDNPAIQGDFYGHFQEEDSLAVAVEFYHEITNVNISLVWVNVESGGVEAEAEVDSSSSSSEDVIELHFHPFELLPQHSYVGHVFRAIITNTNTIVAEFVIAANQTRYTIIMDETDEEL